MWRRRRVLSLVVLALLGAGGGYRLAHRDGPSPVLRTTDTTGSGSFLASLDPWRSRFYIHTFGDNALHIVDTRTGNLLNPTDIIAQSAGPLTNYRVPHIYIDDPSGVGLMQLDDLTLAPLHQLAANTSNSLWFLDEPSDRFYVVSQDLSINILDGRTGRRPPPAPSCRLGYANAVASHPDEHLFLSCGDGTTDMRDARTGRLVRTINTAGLGNCACRRLADDQTGRVFLPGARALGVLDARSGAVLRALPIVTWDGATFELDSHAGSVIELDPRSGDIVAAPYVKPGLSQPARAVVLLDGRTGAILKRWPVPDNPLALLVNPLTGHLLVASAGPVDILGEPQGDGTVRDSRIIKHPTRQRVGREYRRTTCRDRAGGRSVLPRPPSPLW